MIRKIVSNISPSKLCYNKASVRNSSLFLNGPKATETFVFITPHVDFLERIKQREDLQKQLARRNAHIDLNKLENLWDMYKELQTKKADYEKKKEEISKELTSLMKDESNANELEKYKIKIDLIKENIKKLKVPFWSAEETAIVEALNLPNALHPLTPDEDKIIFTNQTAPNNSKNHLQVGEDLKVINFIRNENYYLKGDAAIFELGAKFYFSSLLKKSNFVQFSNPDFVKSIIVEGCGEDHTNPDSTFIVHHNEDSKVNVDSRLHLTGAGSLFSFLAYYAKNVLHNKAFPLKYFAMGRQYKPSPGDEDCLFHVSQSSVIQVFGVGKCANELDNLLQEMIDFVKNSYNQLGYHYRLNIISADKLNMWESMRVAIEMYSSSMKSYVEVGNISVSGDFISKRLLLTYTDDKQSKFPHIVSGTILNVPRLLACVLEQDNDFAIPEQFRVENWKHI